MQVGIEAVGPASDHIIEWRLGNPVATGGPRLRKQIDDEPNRLCRVKIAASAEFCPITLCLGGAQLLSAAGCSFHKFNCAKTQWQPCLVVNVRRAVPPNPSMCHHSRTFEKAVCARDHAEHRFSWPH